MTRAACEKVSFDSCCWRRLEETAGRRGCVRQLALLPTTAPGAADTGTGTPAEAIPELQSTGLTDQWGGRGSQGGLKGGRKISWL